VNTASWDARFALLEVRVAVEIAALTSVRITIPIAAGFLVNPPPSTLNPKPKA